MMVVVVLVAICLGTILNRIRVQREAIAIIERAGGEIVFDYELDENLDRVYPPPEPPGPRWLRSQLGDELFRDVDTVGFNPAEVPPGDEVLAAMSQFPRIECIRLAGASISDDGLRHIRGLSRLKILDLSGTSISDSGLVHIAALTDLEELELSGTSISNTGLKFLRSLRQLKHLELWYTNVDDEGMSIVGDLENLEYLQLAKTHVGEAGLTKLGSLTKLHQLLLSEDSKGKTARLRSRLPNLSISQWPPH